MLHVGRFCVKSLFTHEMDGFDNFLSEIVIEKKGGEEASCTWPRRRVAGFAPGKSCAKAIPECWPVTGSRYTSRLMAERSRFNSSMAAVIASGGSAGFNRSNVARNGDAST